VLHGVDYGDDLALERLMNQQNTTGSGPLAVHGQRADRPLNTAHRPTSNHRLDRDSAQ
jgi:hypothetical protein